MRISDWSSDVCASDLASERGRARSSERRRVATKRRLSASSGSVRVEAAVRLAMSRQSPEVRFGFAVRRIMVTARGIVQNVYGTSFSQPLRGREACLLIAVRRVSGRGVDGKRDVGGTGWLRRRRLGGV